MYTPRNGLGFCHKIAFSPWGFSFKTQPELRRATGWLFATKLLFCLRAFLGKLNPDTKNHRVRHKRVGFSVEKPDPFLRGVTRT